MIFSKQELIELESLSEKNKAVAKACDFIKSFLTDPSKRYYYEICQTAEAFAVEMKAVRDGKTEFAPIITGADKVFDRMFKLITDSKDVFDGIRIGRKEVFPEEVVPENNEAISIADKRANGKKKDGEV